MRPEATQMVKGSFPTAPDESGSVCGGIALRQIDFQPDHF